MPVSGGAANSALGLGVGRSCCIPHLVKHRPDFLLVLLIRQPPLQFVPGDPLGPILCPLRPRLCLCRDWPESLEPMPEPIPAAALRLLDALTGEHHRALAIHYGGELDHARASSSWISSHRFRVSRASSISFRAGLPPVRTPHSRIFLLAWCNSLSVTPNSR